MSWRYRSRRERKQYHGHQRQPDADQAEDQKDFGDCFHLYTPSGSRVDNIAATNTTIIQHGCGFVNSRAGVCCEAACPPLRATHSRISVTILILACIKPPGAAETMSVPERCRRTGRKTAAQRPPHRRGYTPPEKKERIRMETATTRTTRARQTDSSGLLPTGQLSSPS